MPRRWKEALHVAPPKSIDEVFSEPGPDGSSAAEHMGAAIAMTEALIDAIRTTAYNVPEPLGPEAATAIHNAGSGPWPASPHVALNTLDGLMEDLLEQLKRLSPSDWNKSADAGSETFTILALAQGASRVAAERLNAVERIIDALAD